MSAFFGPLCAFLVVLFLNAHVIVAADDPVVAIVNGQKILRSDLKAAQQLLPRQYQSMPLEEMFPALVDSIIDTKLAAADARAQKLHELPLFLTRINRIKEQLLQRIVLHQEMSREITRDVLLERYKKMVEQLKRKEEIHARHILLKSEEEAKAAIEELGKGANFSALAMKKSTGPSGPKGGDLGFFGKGQMVPEFEKAAFEIENGKYSLEPVKTNFGYHVIMVEGRRKAKVPSYESVVDKLRDEISQERGASYVARLRKTAIVERFTFDGKALADQKIIPKGN